MNFRMMDHEGLTCVVADTGKSVVAVGSRPVGVNGASFQSVLRAVDRVVGASDPISVSVAAANLPHAALVKTQDAARIARTADGVWGKISAAVPTASLAPAVSMISEQVPASRKCPTTCAVDS